MKVTTADMCLDAGSSLPAERPSPHLPRYRSRTGGVVETRRTWLRLPDRLPLEEWQRIGEQINRVSDASNWWLGDWLVYGQKQYPQRYRIAIQKTTLDYQTLRNYAWVAKKVHISRRRTKLSFQHHAEVAALPVAEQERWLDEAEAHGWSRNELRRRIKEAGRDDEERRRDKRTQAVIRLRASVEQRSCWEKAALQAECELTEWMVYVLDQAAATAAPE